MSLLSHSLCSLVSQRSILALCVVAAATLTGHAPGHGAPAGNAAASCDPLGVLHNQAGAQLSPQPLHLQPTVFCFAPADVRAAERAVGFPVRRPWSAVHQVVGARLHPVQEQGWRHTEITYVEASEAISLDVCLKGPVPYLEVQEDAAGARTTTAFPLNSAIITMTTAGPGACPTLTVATFGLVHPRPDISVRSNLPKSQVVQIVRLLRNAPH